MLTKMVFQIIHDTKVNMNTEFFDSDGKYDTSNYRFTPTIAGKYMFGASLF
jgi:hypothetical protein